MTMRRILMAATLAVAVAATLAQAPAGGASSADSSAAAMTGSAAAGTASDAMATQQIVAARCQREVRREIAWCMASSFQVDVAEPGHPLTPEPSSEAVNRFWKATKSATAGAARTTAPARMAP